MNKQVFLTGLLCSVLVLVLVSVTSSSLCVLRSSTTGDVMFNATNCSVSSASNANIKQCPNGSHTLLSEDNCCQSDQFFTNNCDYWLTTSASHDQSTIPVVIIDSGTNLVNIVTQNGSQAVGTVHQKENTSRITECSNGNITMISDINNPVENYSIVVNNSAIMIDSTRTVSSGLYRLDLNCNTSVQNQCLYFKLISSMDEIGLNLINLTDAVNLSTCHTDMTDAPTTVSTTVTSTSMTTTTQELSIWLLYNRLLIYVVIGGGLGVGLLLVFIILLCALTGCIAKRRRKRVRSRHQLETAPSIRRTQDAQNSRYQQNQCYSLTNYEENENEQVDGSPPLEEQDPQPLPVQLQLVKVDIPLISTTTLTQDTTEDDVTFDTFKRSQNKSKPALPDPPPPQDPQQEGYYDTVNPTIKSTDQDGPTESYSVLLRSSSLGKSNALAIPKSTSEYSHLNQSTRKRPALTPYSQVSLYHSPRCLHSPSPLPTTSPYNSLEILNPHDHYPGDILTSSWSRPSAVDKISYSTPDIYDCPRELSTTPAKPPKKLPKRIRGRFIIGEGDSEVIYDIPPIKKISEDATSVGSYVDMQSQFHML